MGERQISNGNKTMALPELFLVMATQNPIEQEGTYPLPEAQLDRFLMHVLVDYPDADSEHSILNIVRQEQRTQSPLAAQPAAPVVSQKTIFAARQEVLQLHMEPVIEDYIVALVMASRNPRAIDPELADWLDYGASPRGTIAIDMCARSHAYLQGKDFVSPDDVQAVAHDALRHRLVLSFEAEAAGVTAGDAINRLLTRVACG
jgi:MoxR-like ATPase